MTKAFELAERAPLPAGDEVDDDGRPKRTGTLLTTSSHIITAVIGSGVLSLAWTLAQLGWVAGPLAILAFSVITCFCSILLTDCYRSPDPVHGKRNYSYRDAVRSYLGSKQCNLCALAQYTNLLGVTIGYTITTAISMGAISRAHCFHKNGHEAICEANNVENAIIFAAVQIVLSQIPQFSKLWWLSIVAAVMSFAYSGIGLGLSIAKIAEGRHVTTTLTGVVIGVDVTTSQKIWRTFQSLGNVAFAYSFSTILIEVQDTLKSYPPENKVMKTATTIGISVTTVFYLLCGILGYAAFGNVAPGNFLTGFGFYEPFWLVDIGNICVSIHLFGAYQVFAQPLFQVVEQWSREKWPNNSFLTSERMVNLPMMGECALSPYRLVWRTSYVILTALLAMIFPFFNEILGLIGALAFWPLTVYFPVEMYIKQNSFPRFSMTWTWLKVLSAVCLLISVMAACGSIEGIINSLHGYKPFKI